ncbi:SDR family NAD(P)-dependent oxidoreductase [Actinoplanes sp. NPDC049265]|uniref:SDR family NAD(P)-dependent oxidoreductase n=1 Tax=Actinoplanes sp. NPDC049265 TaxID=3363902 RepID=UPI003711D404
MRLNGKVAVVTGAARGIGAAIALRFAQEGAAVVCADRLEDELAATVAGIVESGGTGRASVVDVASEEDNQRLVRDAVTAFGRLDVFHANAAVQVMGDLTRTSPIDWDDMYAVNVRGVALGIRHAVPAMRRSGGGSILITASLLGIVGDPDLPYYGATKGALRSLCRSVAAAYGPDNIRCNTICPGDVETALLQEFFDFQDDPAEARRRITEHYPLRRFATPQDVAGAALFLAGDEARYISGIDLPVDGGLLARIY